MTRCRQSLRRATFSLFWVSVIMLLLSKVRRQRRRPCWAGARRHGGDELVYFTKPARWATRCYSNASLMSLLEPRRLRSGGVPHTLFFCSPSTAVCEQTRE